MQHAPEGRTPDPGQHLDADLAKIARSTGNWNRPSEGPAYPVNSQSSICPPSDRACDKWLEGYRVAGLDGIDLHHLYRAIAWLGEELADQEGRTRAPRAIKDLVEERLFARRRDLFNDLDLVFFDTSALYFQQSWLKLLRSIHIGDWAGRRMNSCAPAA